MTPDRAHAIYVALLCRGEFPATDDILDALATIAGMRVEEDWRIVPHSTHQPRPKQAGFTYPKEQA